MLKTSLCAMGLFLASGMSYAAVPDYAGCTESDYVTIDQPEITIEFQGSSYKPACIKVKKGTKVIIPASNRHPLQAAQDFDGVVNPLRLEGADHLENQTLIAEMPGFYGYYCTRHADSHDGSGMGGMIWVTDGY
jgi:plastocyanin